MNLRFVVFNTSSIFLDFAFSAKPSWKYVGFDTSMTEIPFATLLSTEVLMGGYRITPS